MSETNSFATLLQIAGGYCVPRCLHIVADLGVADALDDTPRTAAELAASVGAHPDALGRALRLLAAYGVFEVQGDTFRAAMTDLSSAELPSILATYDFSGLTKIVDVGGAAARCCAASSNSTRRPAGCCSA
jgi:hypothetical protein